MPQTSTRLARLEDIPVLAMFEREIARLSFPDHPIEDLEYHAQRLRKAMAREPEGMTVLVDAESGEVLAWLWLATKTTLATGEHYGVVRSIYVRPVARRAGLGMMLAEYAMRHFQERGIPRVVATVHDANLVGARTLAKAGFERAHITFERRTPPDETPAPKAE